MRNEEVEKKKKEGERRHQGKKNKRSKIKRTTDPNKPRIARFESKFAFAQRKFIEVKQVDIFERAIVRCGVESLWVA